MVDVFSSEPFSIVRENRVGVSMNGLPCVSDAGADSSIVIVDVVGGDSACLVVVF